MEANKIEEYKTNVSYAIELYQKLTGEQLNKKMPLLVFNKLYSNSKTVEYVREIVENHGKGELLLLANFLS